MYHLVYEGESYAQKESVEDLKKHISLVQDYIRQELNALSISLKDVHKYLMLIDSNVSLNGVEGIRAYKTTLPVNYSLIDINTNWFFKDTKINIESAVGAYFYDYTILKGQTLELNGKLITPNPETVIDDSYVSAMIDYMMSYNTKHYIKRPLISEESIIKSIKVDGEDYVLSNFHSRITFSLKEAYETIFIPNSKCSLFINNQPEVIRKELISKVTEILKKDYDKMVLLLPKLVPIK